MTYTELTRLQAVLAGQKADRPPVICPGGMMSGATTAVLQKAGGNVHTDAAVMTAVAESIRSATGFENLGVPFCMTLEADLFGSYVDLGNDGVEPCVTEYGETELAGILSRPLPDPQVDGRGPTVLAAIRMLTERNRETPTIGNLTGPVSMATSIIDPLVFFRLMRKKPEDVLATLNHLTDFLVRFAQAQISAGAHVIAIADPTATGEIIGGANFNRFVVPTMGRLVGEIHAAGAQAVVHICGNATVLLEDLRKIGAAALSFDSIVNMTKARQVLGEIPLMGNASTQLLHMGEGGRIARASRLLLEQGVDIIAPACGISLATPPENLAVFTNTVKEYGNCDRA